MLTIRHQTDNHAQIALDCSAGAKWWNFTMQDGKTSIRTQSKVAGATLSHCFHFQKWKFYLSERSLDKQPNYLLGSPVSGVVTCVSNPESTAFWLSELPFSEYILCPYMKHQSTLPGIECLNENIVKWLHFTVKIMNSHFNFAYLTLSFASSWGNCVCLSSCKCKEQK